MTKESVVKPSKHLSKIDKIHPEMIDPVEKVVIKKFLSRPRPHPHKCCSPILPRNQIGDGNLRITERCSNTFNFLNVKVKTPSWVKKAPTTRDAWEEAANVSSIQEVTIKTPTALITSRGSKSTRPKTLSVKNSLENNVSRYRRRVSEYSFKSPFPIHKPSLKSSSESFMNPQSSFHPKLVCECPLNAQVLSEDPQCLPRVILKDSANFAKFRRDIGDSDSRAVDTVTTFPGRKFHAKEFHRPAINIPSTEKSRHSESNRRFRGLSTFFASNKKTTEKITGQRKSGNSLFSLAIPEGGKSQMKISEPSCQPCSLNDGYVVKRIIYTVEEHMKNSLSRNRPREPTISPRIGG